MLELISYKSANKRIVILGFGLEGQSSLRFLNSGHLENEIVVIDRNPELWQHSHIQELGVASFGGEDYLQHLHHDDFIIKSPGVKLGEEFKGYRTHSQTSLFLERYREQTIGITGTKGKSTTSTMIYQLLKDQSKEAFLVGNIGQPAFDLVEKINPKTWIVYELSAHQLQCVSFGPKYAILLNLMPEHLDYFGNTELYYLAKLQIFNEQLMDSFSFVSPDYMDISKSLKSFKNTDPILKVESGDITKNEEVILKHTDLKYLLGHHHLMNIQAVLELVMHLELDLNTAIESIKTFHPLPHRQEFLGDKNGLRFINDSISTIPQSAIQAVKAIGEVDYLILGGLDRGVDYSNLVDFLLGSSFQKVFFLGEAGRRILDELQMKHRKTDFAYSLHDRLQEITEDLLNIKKGTVLLSPAAASYDAFVNFEERGRYFKEIFLKK